MSLTFTTVITVHLSLCVFSILLLPLLTSRYCLRHVSSDCFIIFCIAIMIRALFPVEFSFSRTIRDSKVSPVIRDVMLFPVTAGDRSIYVCQLLFFLWITVAVVLIIRKLVLYHNIEKLVRRMPECDDEIVREAWKTVKAKYPSQDHIRVVRVGMKISPQVMGIRYPVILLPEYTFSQSEYQLILEHEILHCLWHDNLLKAAVDCLCAFCWWNPILHFLKKKISDLIEIGNDNRMTRFLSADEKTIYMQCLTDMVRRIEQPPVPLALPLGRPDQKILYRRMYLIGYPGTVSRIKNGSILFLLLLFLWIATSFTLEPYELLEKPLFVLDKTNAYFIQDEDHYEVYYKGKYMYSTDSLDYFADDIPIYTKED